MEWIVWAALGVIGGGCLGVGFTLGAHFNPGQAALRNANRSLKQQNNQLEAALQTPAPQPTATSLGGGGGLEAIGAMLQSGDFDLKTLIPIVLKNPELIKVGLEAIQGKVGKAPPGAPPEPPPSGAAPAANYI